MQAVSPKIGQVCHSGAGATPAGTRRWMPLLTVTKMSRGWTR
ncbi:hypothetical protein D516_1261 [Rhodobacter sp. AKP1]|nr:hypothetical protein D516_1261 [Rhodobacter sp. AKP1]